MSDGEVGDGAPHIPESEVQWRFSRSSGPGGQSVNTTDSRVELLWDLTRTRALSPTQRDRLRAGLAERFPDGIVTIAASEYKSQHRNRVAALERLDAMVARALRPVKRRRPTRATRGSQRRRIESKKRRGEIKRLRRPPD